MFTIALAEDPLQKGIVLPIIKQIQGCMVSIEANNGFNLLSSLCSCKKTPNIALVDVEMPIMDGLACTNFMRYHYPGIHVLVMMKDTNPFTVHEFIEAGAKGYIIKGKKMTNIFLEAFRTLCDGGMFMGNVSVAKNIYHNIQHAPHQTGSTFLHEPCLSEKERTFLQLATSAISYCQIAQLMNVGKDSVYNYQKSLKEKLGISSRQEFMLYAIQHGIAKVARFR